MTNRRVPNKLPWNAEAIAAFETLKGKLASLPELGSPAKSFILSTDASQKAIGACLSQKIDGEEMPIALISKELSSAEAKWSTIEREAFAVVWALGRLDTWLWGAGGNVVSDHSSLTYLARSASASARWTRWALALQKYNLEIYHVTGALNKCADALSRSC